MEQNELLQRIVVDPAIQHGKPCVKGTRTPVYVIIEALALGMEPEKIKREYGLIDDGDIRACLLFAASLADEHEMVPAIGLQQ
jgi:uncharacterized protein (DUF433 family)